MAAKSAGSVVPGRSGFTLIELLIATSIMFATLSLAMFGYQLYDKQWRKNKTGVEQAYLRYKSLDLLSNAIQGIVPYLVNSTDKHGFYFLGDDQGFTAITQAPVVNSQFPAVIRVFAETDKDGVSRLVYEEASLSKTWLIDAEQQLDFSERIIITQTRKPITFKYFVVPDVMTPTEFDSNDELIDRRQWLTQHDGLLAGTHPDELQIDIGGFPLFATISSRAQVSAARTDVESI
ncbi:MAG: type II secretion system protein J [Chromatiaceae bacterium]|jgi:prepilin-type N-terminal cleavage/methylation domain-containing protein